MATANIDAAGVASYQFDLEWDLPGTWDEADGDPLVVHTGSIASGAEAVPEAWQINVRTGISTASIPLHPGAAAWFRDRKR